MADDEGDKKEDLLKRKKQDTSKPASGKFDVPIPPYLVTAGIFCDANSDGTVPPGAFLLYHGPMQTGRVQQISGEGSGEGVGVFGAEPGQVQQGSGEGSTSSSGRLWCRARSGSTVFLRRFGEGVGGFGAEPGQVQQGSEEGSGRLRCRARSGSTGFRRRFRRRFWRRFREASRSGFGAEPGQVQQDLRPFNSRKPS